MKELLQKKTVKIGIAVIILAVAAGIISINARSAQRQREYDSHVDAAEKYLTELDYEQAIAEYTLALEIEPNNEEVLNALEQTYLDYAQSLADAGEFEKAVSVLEEGYALIGRESLREKTEELKNGQRQIEVEVQQSAEEEADGMIEFSFELTDITIMGYDLFDDHFEEICAAYGCPAGRDFSHSERFSTVDNEYGSLSASVTVGDGVVGDEGYYKDLSVENYDFDSPFPCALSYMCGYYDGYIDMSLEMYTMLDLELYNINVPVVPGSSYEDLSQILQIEEIKKKGEQYADMHWKCQMTNGSSIDYSEIMFADDEILYTLTIVLDSGWFIIEVDGFGDSITECRYFFRLKPV